jgi:hypothetical protein
MKIKITLDHTTRTATLADNPAHCSLMAQLPLTLPLEDYAVCEKSRIQHSNSTPLAPPSVIKARRAISPITRSGIIWRCFIGMT